MIFCKHKNSEVICWHLTHGYNSNDFSFLEIQFRCNDCGKYYFRYVYDWNECCKFMNKYPDKEWSNSCKPVLN